MNRTITSVEELDALPVGSVIQEADYFYPDEEFGFKGTVMPREEEGWLYDNCCNRHQPSNEIELPVTVLYVPGEQLLPLPTRDEIAEAIDDVIGYLDLNVVTRAEMDTATEQAADLAAIRQRANNATEGPWMHELNQFRGTYWVDTKPDLTGQGIATRVYTEPDAEFIAHAREDIPKLLDHVDRLTETLAALADTLPDPPEETP